MSGRQRSSGGRGMSREVQVSKKLSWLLRHGVEKEGLKLGQDGYLNMATVLANRNLRSLKVTFDEVQTIVRSNDKQRFNLIPDPLRFKSADNNAPVPSDDPADWVIRANQGHSIKLESDEGLLTPISSENIPNAAIHGTTHSNWVKIVATGGLKPMTRNHVHFASGLPAGFESLAHGEGGQNAAAVISGMRSSSTVLIYLDIEKALAAGLPLGTSQNGVILSEGDSDGHIPLHLFKLVEDRTGEGVLLQDGRIIKEAPSSWDKVSTRR